MKKVLIAAVLLMTLTTGCTKNFEVEEKPEFTQERYEYLYAFCEQMFEYKAEYLHVIQTDSNKGWAVVDAMVKSGSAVYELKDTDYAELAIVFEHLEYAGHQFSFFMDSGKGTYYMEGVKHYSRAEELFDRLKR